MTTLGKEIPSGPRPNDAKAGPTGEPMTPILSASLVVLVPGRPDKSISTIMLQRSARMGSSFRSAVVFPGGALDLADEAVMGCSTETSEADDLSVEVYAQSLRLCALRETFEETGLLLLPSNKQNEGVPWSRAVGHKEAGLSVHEWSTWRDKVHHNAAEFPTFLRDIASKIGIPDDNTSSPMPLADLSYHSHWITPRSVVRPGKRFSAHFFITVLDGSDELSSHHNSDEAQGNFALSADGTETTSLRVLPTDDFIHATLRDEIVLYPPQFYILADLAETTRKQGASNSIEEQIRLLRPLVFGQRHRVEADAQVTTIEEEPRNLHGRNYAWDRSTDRPTGWVSSSNNRVTAVEPHALVGQGANVALNFSKTDKVANTEEEDNEEEDEPFVFPLVLPGDYAASSSQTSQFHPDTSQTDWTKVHPDQRPLNRVYVSPRQRKDGGGLIPRGARRRGVEGLRDWQIGLELKAVDAEAEAEDDDDAPTKAKL